MPPPFQQSPHYNQGAFVEWCDRYHLKLNIHKTEELVIDPRKNKAAPSPVMIKGLEIERVVTYKYLGIIIDNSLLWVENTDAILKKVHTRLHCLRKLRSFDLCSQLLQSFYTLTILSVLTFGLTCWGGNLRKQDTSRINKLIKKAREIIGKTQESIKTHDHKRSLKKLSNS